MDGCLPCPKCGNTKLIPDIFVGEFILVRIHCIKCDTHSEKADTTREAILKWNTMCVEKRLSI